MFKDLPDSEQRSSKALSMKKQHFMPLTEYLLNLTFFRSLFRQQPHTLSSKKAVQILYKTLACKTALYFLRNTFPSRNSYESFNLPSLYGNLIVFVTLI